MSNDEESPETATKIKNDTLTTPKSPLRLRSIFDIPPPLKRIFDKFPQVTYAENERPLRAPAAIRKEHTLHVFTTPEGARDGKPSYNPGCLRWQAYLRFSDIPFHLVPATNHSSPSGVLPFLLTATLKDDSASAPDAVTSNKLRKWVKNRSSKAGEEPEDLRYEAYTSLVDTGLRRAWLYQLYIDPANASLAYKLYVAPCSSQVFVQMAIAHQLQEAAEAELAKSSFSGIVSEADIFRAAESAIEALATVLGDNDWFFGHVQPSLLDASVFAYTHLILDDGLQWGENPLAQQLQKHPNLMKFRDRILEHYF